MINIDNTKNITLFNKEFKIYSRRSCCTKSNKRTLYLELINSCNAKCDFCSAKDITNETRREVNLDHLKIVLDELIRNDVIDKISITGGEPLLYSNLKGLFDLLDKYVGARLLDFYALTTNGILLDKYKGILLSSQIKYVNISRHHFTDNANKRIFNSNVPSCHDIKHVTDYFLSSDKRFRLNATLTDAFYKKEDIIQYVEHAEKMGIHDILFKKDFNSPNDDLLDGFYKYLELNISSKDVNIVHSNKCQCINISTVTGKIQLRTVDTWLEKKNEEKGEFIRNLIYSSDNILKGGWSNKSIEIYNGGNGNGNV